MKLLDNGGKRGSTWNPKGDRNSDKVTMYWGTDIKNYGIEYYGFGILVIQVVQG